MILLASAITYGSGADFGWPEWALVGWALLMVVRWTLHDPTR